MTLKKTKRAPELLIATIAYLWGICAQAGLPQMEAPSRGEGGNIIETMQNYAFDGVSLLALLISGAAFCGVAYHAYSTFAEVQTGKKTWGQFGLTCLVGIVLLVVSIWLLTKAIGIL
jgi:integrating conjugative element membrane protein (TIGR03745 family)